MSKGSWYRDLQISHDEWGNKFDQIDWGNNGRAQRTEDEDLPELREAGEGDSGRPEGAREGVPGTQEEHVGTTGVSDEGGEQ